MNRVAPARDLRPVAREVMKSEGFVLELPPAAATELAALEPADIDAAIAGGVRDLRGLLWSSTDNLESRDLDQIEYAERLAGDDLRVLVGIADVDALVPIGSALDQFAAQNTASVYTGVATFSMLPEELSTDLTSLAEGGDRLAIVIEMTVDRRGRVRSGTVYRAAVRNRAKLDYDTVGAWLEGAAPPPPKVAHTRGLADQLRLQDEAAERLRAMRELRGALELETIEATVIGIDGKVGDLVVKRKNRASALVENFMISANIAVATFLETAGVTSIQRVVRAPERWPRIVEMAAALGAELPKTPDVRALAAFLDVQREADPVAYPDLSLAIVKLIGGGDYIVEGPDVEVAGHFGIGARDYTHATAPNRRYVDLVIQRLVKAALAGQPAPYDVPALEAIAAHCNDRDSAAAAVERQMRKHAAIDLMRRRIGEEFEGIVTGVSKKGTFLRTIAPPVEGMVVQGEAGLDVGDQVHVKLVGVDSDKGFIDFARV